MSNLNNPSFAAYEHWSEYNDDPADVKKRKPSTAQVAKTDKGRVMQWAAEERELAFNEGEGQDPESLLIAKEERKHRRQYSVGESWARRNLGKLRFNQKIIGEVADEADQLGENDVDKALRLIARLEGLKLPAAIDRKLEKDYQDVVDANHGRKEQLKTINSVLTLLYKIAEAVDEEAVDEENERVKEFTHQAIAELRNKRKALKAISDILSLPKEKRMKNWYQVVQGWNREVLQAGKYLLALFTRARTANPDIMLKAYPKIAHEAPKLKQDYIEAVTAFTAGHNHFSFSEEVMEEARQHKSPLARGIDGVMKRERPEEDQVESFYATVTRLPRKKIKEVLKMIA
ncbi:hypothetical protein JW752_03060 [Candidatus Peregrinibacteria bacterium]|nr:hypothetical protein [Candidatus Peregrinibacteria bacterium]